ncbi:MAG: YdcF family protein [Eubacterium sp.]|nr:YdcF family protein [Eubacterium sp.]
MSVKKEIIWIISVFIILAGAATIWVFVSAKTYVAHINLPGGDYRDIRVRPEEDICDITTLDREGRSMTLLLENGKTGKTNLVVTCVHEENPSLTDSVTLGIKVSRHGLFFVGPDSDFRGHPVLPGMMAVFTLFVAIRMIIRYRRLRERYPYSYNALIRLSLFLFFILQGILFAGLCVAGIIFNGRMTAYISFLLGGLVMSLAVLFLIPFIVIFAIVMIISNLSLIRHEGIRFANTLGFILSGLMIAGSILILLSVVYNPGYLAVDPAGRTIEMARAVSSPIFVYLVCVLAATEYRLFRVARHEPSYDQDFIIILGCRIRPDGTLFPLLKGRADRAVTFYKKQLQATGKKAVFVPSGGRGTDEVMSEAEAVRNYLMEQGISEEQILPETESKTTHENMKFSKMLIDERKKDAGVIFSTNNYHVFRSGMIAEQMGFHAEGIGSRTKWYYSPNAQVREFISLLAGKWRTHAVICLALAGIALAMVYAPGLV